MPPEFTSKSAQKIYDAFFKSLAKKENGEKLQAFCDIYFAHTPEEEIMHLIERGELADQMSSLYNIARIYKAGSISVDVRRAEYTPNIIVEVHTMDTPFLVDSIWEELHSRNLEVHHSFHPVVLTKRDKDGVLLDFAENTITDTPPVGYRKECIIHIEVDYLHTDKEINDLSRALKKILKQTKEVTKDFPKMLAQMDALEERLSKAKDSDKHAEELAFIDWIRNDNFIFLGYRHYDISRRGDKTYIQLTPNQGLGLLRNDKESSAYQKTCLDDMPANLKHYYTNNAELVTLTKTLDKSPVHRRADMEYIGIKEFNKKGDVIGEHRFVGLLTSRAYTLNPRDIPLIRRKIVDVLERQTNLSPTTHNHKALVNILETYPRDELFQISVEDLERIAIGALQLKERQQVRVFVRHSRHELFVTVMVYIPRDLMSSALRKRIVDEVSDAYNASDIEFMTTINESRLARIFMKVRSRPPETPNISDDEVERRIKDIARSWTGELERSLIALHGEAKGRKLFAQYGNAFRIGYQEANPTCSAVHDIAAFENMETHNIDFLVDVDTKCSNSMHLKIFHRGEHLNLSDIMPIFDKLDLMITDEHPTQIKQGVDKPIWIHDFGVKVKPHQKAATDPKALSVLAEALERAWHGELENDSLNSLILSAGLDVRQIVILRSLVAYLKQIGLSYSREYMRKTLTNNPTIALLLTDLFDARFDLDIDSKKRDTLVENTRQAIRQALENVASLDEDTILRRMKNVIMAMVRTNAFQREEATDAFAFKLRPSLVPDMPKPCPMFEIFVYHSTVEGVHLRGGKVARGGLRWSDRPEDFRTEVLGLVKAQMTKNAVIIPMGSKGGFVMKKDPAGSSRAEVMAAVEGVYRTFISSLLSVTDTTQNGKVIAPRNVVRHDEDDPYLVVAADKGTATFSDVANSVAENADYWDGVTTGFWLGDAFASGGSNGYDHKKMGITARGAWECVKTHFREKGKDIQTEEFTAVGIGDMGGDVFGNGMLLSEKTQLVAAFNHLHIFVDPTPDAAKTFKERERMFKTPGITWMDFDRKIMSKGGDVYDRSAKSITISEEAKVALGADKCTMTPDDLIQTILKAPVDLLWNGGIGTFVKATSETHHEVGDRANNKIRINGADVRASVIGEGGNLGCTQLGRIEYAQNGGVINTDAIDNSAGVNCSDNEVNIKILLRAAAEQEGLKMSARNTLLAKMTDEVGLLSLKANYQQSQTISMAEEVSQDLMEPYKRLMHGLEHKGLLDRQIEFLPTDEEIETRVRLGHGLMRPEISVLMAYAKMDLYDTLLNSKLPSEKVLEDMYLYSYFPAPLVKKYRSLIDTHQLKKEIVATQVTNDLINRMGLTFIDRMREETGHAECTITRAYIIAKQLTDADALYAEIDELDNKIPAEVQKEMRRAVKKALERVAYWFLRNGEDRPLSIEKAITKYDTIFAGAMAEMPHALSDNVKKRIDGRAEQWEAQGLKKRLAEKFAYLAVFAAVPDIAAITLRSKQSTSQVIESYFRVGDALKLDMLHTKTLMIPVENNWQRVGRISIIDSLLTAQSDITYQVLDVKKQHKAPAIEDALAKWLERREDNTKQYLNLAAEVRNAETPSHAMLSVILGHLKGLSQLKD